MGTRTMSPAACLAGPRALLSGDNAGNCCSFDPFLHQGDWVLRLGQQTCAHGRKRIKSSLPLWVNGHDALGSLVSSSVLFTTLWLRDSNVQFLPYCFTRVVCRWLVGQSSGQEAQRNSLVDLWGHTQGCNTKPSQGTCTLMGLGFGADEIFLLKSMRPESVSQQQKQSRNWPFPSTSSHWEEKQRSGFDVKNIGQPF